MKSLIRALNERKEVDVFIRNMGSIAAKVLDVLASDVWEAESSKFSYDNTEIVYITTEPHKLILFLDGSDAVIKLSRKGIAKDVLDAIKKAYGSLVKIDEVERDVWEITDPNPLHESESGMIEFKHPDLVGRIRKAEKELTAELDSIWHQAAEMLGLEQSFRKSEKDYTKVERSFSKRQTDRVAAIKEALARYGHEDVALRAAEAGTIPSKPGVAESRLKALEERATRLEAALKGK